MKVDFIIVGQGIAGSILAFELEERGKSVLVVDQEIPNSASRVSSAVINPITGRRLAKSWMFEELNLAAQECYQRIGQSIGKEIIESLPILRVFTSAKEQNDFNGRLAEEDYEGYLLDWKETIPGLIDELGAGIIQKSYRIDNPFMLDSFRARWKSAGKLVEESFDYSKVAFNVSAKTTTVQYKNIEAQHLIFCEGFRLIDNPFFNWIPLLPNKGEALIIECAELEETRMYKKGVSLVPLGNHQFWVGTTLNKHDVSVGMGPHAEWQLCSKLDHLLDLPYTVLERKAGIRPTNSRFRRPYIGAHFAHPEMYVFNGFGTKGSSLVPYFASELVEHLLGGGDLHKEVRIEKFFPEA